MTTKFYGLMIFVWIIVFYITLADGGLFRIRHSKILLDNPVHILEASYAPRSRHRLFPRRQPQNHFDPPYNFGGTNKLVRQRSYLNSVHRENNAYRATTHVFDPDPLHPPIHGSTARSGSGIVGAVQSYRPKPSSSQFVFSPTKLQTCASKDRRHHHVNDYPAQRSSQLQLPDFAQEPSHQSTGRGSVCVPPPDNFKVSYHGNKCYYYSCIYFSTWFAAMTQCQKAPLRGHLVSILNAKENNFLHETLTEMLSSQNCTLTLVNPRAWIGLTRYDRHQSPALNGLMWANADAEFPVFYENWARRQPDDVKGQNLCTSISVDNSEWALENCSDENLPFICEVDAIDERWLRRRSRKRKRH